MEPWVGYIVFAALTLSFILLIILWRYHCRNERALFVNRFITGGRDMRTGIVTASLVSLWLWPGTIMGAIIMGQLFGLSGPYWFAAFSATQILFLTALITNFRAHAEEARSLPEYILHRFGPAAHRVAVVLSLLTCGYMLLWVSYQGIRLLAVMTGVSSALLALVVPVSLLVPAFIGGLRGTIVLSYLQALIIGGLTVALALLYYSKFGDLGLYRGLALMAPERDVLKLGSGEAVLLAVSVMVANIGLIIADQSYWQRAIAAAPRATGPAFLYGGVIAFAIPLALGTAFGAGWLSLTEGGGASLASLSNGKALFQFILSELGGWAALAFLLVLVTAMFSTGTAELLALGSLLTVDIIERRRKQPSSESELMRVMRICMVVLAVVCSGLLVAWLRVCEDNREVRSMLVSTLALLRISVINAAVIPFTLAILWRRSSSVGTLWGVVAGLVSGTAAGTALGLDRIEPAGLFIADADVALTVSAVSLLSSGVVCLFGAMVYGRQRRRVAVAIQVRERTSMYSERTGVLLVFGVLLIAIVISFLNRSDFSVRGLAVWIIGGLILLFLSTAYVTLMPIKEYFETSEQREEPDLQPVARFNWLRNRNDKPNP